MARIEKTVFISYRRTDVYTALAVYENLKNQGYDVFFDYRSISSGDFEQIITSNIRARAHFLLILTPTALDRCNEPGDWLRREIEFAIDERRNIIPLFFRGFRFGDPSITEKLTGKLRNISRYNGLNVHEDYFDEAMQRLRTQYLNIPLNTVLHPVSTEVRKVVQEEKLAADEALEQIDDVKELVKQTDKIPDLPIAEPYPKQAVSPARGVQKSPILNMRFKTGLIGGILGGLLIFSLLIWGVSSLVSNFSAALEPTRDVQAGRTASLPQESASPSEPTIAATPTLGIGSTLIGKDGMTLLYVPAGEFTMGSATGTGDERPVHTVYLDAFWIDQTEVTNAMYSECVSAGVCNNPLKGGSYTRNFYFRDSTFDNYPMIHVTWDDAQTYCSWVDRRLPTEAEWEKAASWDTTNQTQYAYPWGNSSPNNILLNYGRKVGDTTEVGKYPDGASPYGALDMAGNVAEWVEDWYGDTYYANSPSSNPLGPAAGQYRVLRGGSYLDHNYSSTFRPSYNPTDSSNYIGFRCAVSAAGQAGVSHIIPSTTPIPADLPSGTLIEYRVLAGDTLAGIAAKFKSLPNNIIEINNIENPNALIVGQILQIPVNLVTATATLPSTSTPVRPTQTATLPPTSTPVLPTPTATP